MKSTSSSRQTTSSTLDSYAVLKYPLSTEKSVRQMEFENKIAFVVDSGASKAQIKNAVEEQFKVKVVQVNTQHSFSGQKRASIKLRADYPASDLGADLGLI